MAEIRKDTLCKYCLGCEKLNDRNFAGVRLCKTFAAGYESWRKLFEESLKENYRNKHK